jgi:Ca2+-binding EF-hand superfamily protein
MQERFARKNEAADLRRAFDTMDKKHDGKLDAEELNQLFVALGHKTKKVCLCSFVPSVRNVLGINASLVAGKKP